MSGLFRAGRRIGSCQPAHARDIDGDDFVINGSKIWTTWAHHSDWIFVLVRSDPDAPRKQAGISFVLIDLKTTGINIRPIKLLAGDEEFAEVFFDDVRVPMENLVGDLHDGWRVANALLAHERLGTANPQLLFEAIERVAVAAATGAADDPYFRERLAELDIDTVGFAAMFSHAAKIANAERLLGLDASIMKINGTELLQRICDLLLEAAGTGAALIDRIDIEAGPIEIAPLFLQVRRAQRSMAGRARSSATSCPSGYSVCRGEKFGFSLPVLPPPLRVRGFCLHLPLRKAPAPVTKATASAFGLAGTALGAR